MKYNPLYVYFTCFGAKHCIFFSLQNRRDQNQSTGSSSNKESAAKVLLKMKQRRRSSRWAIWRMSGLETLMPKFRSTMLNAKPGMAWKCTHWLSKSDEKSKLFRLYDSSLRLHGNFKMVLCSGCETCCKPRKSSTCRTSWKRRRRCLSDKRRCASEPRSWRSSARRIGRRSSNRSSESNGG